MADSGRRLEGKKVLITGSGQGIGQAIAVRLAKEGCDIAVNYRTKAEEATETVKAVEAVGRKASPVQGDVSKVSECRRLVRQSAEQLGGLDFIVNNAGIEINADFTEVKEEDYQAVIDVNMTGPFFITQEFARLRTELGGGGKVVNISSVHEDLPFPHFTAYCMAKGGLKMMMRNLSIELAPLGITINNVAPGAIRTPINAKLLESPDKLKDLLENIPLKRLGETSDVTGVVSFLLSPDADYVTGATYFVDGGLTWNYSEQ